MRAQNTTTEWNRKIRLSDVPGYQGNLDIVIQYAVEANDGDLMNKAVALDTHVIPAILSALNQEVPKVILRASDGHYRVRANTKVGVKIFDADFWYELKEAGDLDLYTGATEAEFLAMPFEVL